MTTSSGILEARPFSKYLAGELRTPQQPGWWYYYLYGALVKTPEAALLLFAGSLLLLIVHPRDIDATSIMLLLGTVVAIFVGLSLRPNLNSHVRDIIPALPFLCVLAGRLGPWAEKGRIMRMSLITAATLTAMATGVTAHPDHIAYFNWTSGGPDRGSEHLADSNLDWGQGLFALRDWLQEQTPDTETQLAYQGAINPEDVGISYQPLDAYASVPGLHVVSATLVTGIPWYVQAPSACRVFPAADEYAMYRKLVPIARPGHAIYVYHVSEDDLEQLGGGHQPRH